jgi:DNA-binding NtrC family response regulator
MSSKRSPADTQTIPLATVSDAPALPGCLIRVLSGASEGQALVLEEGEAVVGRGPDCDLVLEDGQVSNRQLRVRVAEQGFEVTDLGSKNGTYYMMTRIERAVLSHGATLEVGNSRLLISPRVSEQGDHYSQRSHYGALLGTSPAMRRLYRVLEQIEPTQLTTLILGETGVGKELVAREIHAHSQRAQGPFEVCDCASLAPNLVESELFGHRRGAFTGADSNHPGTFSRAHGGTIFLDEIGELPLALQPKLLRVLESRQVRPLGSSTTVDVDVRVIAATNRPLETEAQRASFRQDLYFRLAEVTVEVPPLRERRTDIPLLARGLLKEMGSGELELSPATLELFVTGYVWPGNVRELRNALARFRVMGTTPMEFGEVTDGRAEPSLEVHVGEPFQEEKRRILDAFERDYLSRQLQLAEHNISQAARASGMERMNFKRLLKKHGLLEGESKP